MCIYVIHNISHCYIVILSCRAQNDTSLSRAKDNIIMQGAQQGGSGEARGTCWHTGKAESELVGQNLKRKLSLRHNLLSNSTLLMQVGKLPDLTLALGSNMALVCPYQGGPLQNIDWLHSGSNPWWSRPINRCLNSPSLKAQNWYFELFFIPSGVGRIFPM